MQEHFNTEGFLAALTWNVTELCIRLKPLRELHGSFKGTVQRKIQNACMSFTCVLLFYFCLFLWLYTKPCFVCDWCFKKSIEEPIKMSSQKFWGPHLIFELWSLALAIEQHVVVAVQPLPEKEARWSRVEKTNVSTAGVSKTELLATILPAHVFETTRSKAPKIFVLVTLNCPFKIQVERLIIHSRPHFSFKCIFFFFNVLLLCWHAHIVVTTGYFCTSSPLPWVTRGNQHNNEFTTSPLLSSVVPCSRCGRSSPCQTL